MRRAFVPAALVLCLALAGCGQDLLAGGHNEGEVRAVVVDEPERGSAAREPSRSLAPAGAPSSATQVAFEGTLRVEASVELLDAAGRVTRVAPAGAAGTLRIAAGDTAVLGTAAVEARRYVRARFTISGLEAEVAGGLALGGVQLPGTVRVRLAAPVVVDAPVDLEVEVAGRHRVVLDLNALEWLPLASPDTRLVPAAAFLAAVEVRVAP